MPLGAGPPRDQRSSGHLHCARSWHQIPYRKGPSSVPRPRLLGNAAVLGGALISAGSQQAARHRHTGPSVAGPEASECSVAVPPGPRKPPTLLRTKLNFPSLGRRRPVLGSLERAPWLPFFPFSLDLLFVCLFSFPCSKEGLPPGPGRRLSGVLALRGVSARAPAPPGHARLAFHRPSLRDGAHLRASEWRLGTPSKKPEGSRVWGGGRFVRASGRHRPLHQPVWGPPRGHRGGDGSRSHWLLCPPAPPAGPYTVNRPRGRSPWDRGAWARSPPVGAGLAPGIAVCERPVSSRTLCPEAPRPKQPATMPQASVSLYYSFSRY